MRATFFVLGKNLEGASLGGDPGRAAALAARALREGHVLGNHTMTHSAELRVNELLSEVEMCDALLHRAGVDPSFQPAIPVRLPFGPYRPNGAQLLEALEALGRPHFHWTVDPGDWRPGRSAHEIAAATIARVEAQWQQSRLPVVLLHDASEDTGTAAEPRAARRDATVDAVDRLCAWLTERAARCVRALEMPAPRVIAPPSPPHG